MMLISEIFYSIQGEGEWTGVPSVFVRTAGCNLRCRWCDTPYASWEAVGISMSVEEIIGEIEKYPTRFVVLTGGEPMIAKKIHSLAAQLHERGKIITLETAGTVPPEGIHCDLASLSPKLSNSTPLPGTIEPDWIDRHEVNRRKAGVLREWVNDYNVQLKFVVTERHDLKEIEEIVADLQVQPWKVQLMPEGTTVEALQSHRTALIALCLEKGYRFCDRLHIHLFGNKRGT